MTKGKKLFQGICDYFVITVAAFVYCMAWSSFLIPHDIASGGVVGACTIIQFATFGLVPVSFSFVVINAVLLLLGFLILGKGFGVKTIYVIIITTLFFDLIPRFAWLTSIEGQPLFISDKLLVSVIGGLLEAIGINVIFQRGGSTGGTDVIALILNKFWPITPGKVYLYTDLFIIASVLLVPGKTVQDMLYGYITMVTFTLMLDFFMMGRTSSVQVMIFSEKTSEIADYIVHQLDRGVTAIKSVGWYSKKDRDVLLVVTRKYRLSALTKAIKQIDRKAFVTITPTSSVYGEGFEEIKTGIERKKLKVSNTDE